MKASESAREQFPILGERGATIDFQLVADHGKQAQANHYQTVQRLSERGGLSWCELYAVLHNRKWQKMDNNEAMIGCRELEARYLSAVHPSADITQAEARGREQGLKEAAAVASAEIVETFEDSPEVDTVCNSVVREIAANITALIPGEPA